MNEFYKSMDKLVKEHTFVHFLDFSKSEHFDNEHFSEPNVLNVKGSAKFSKYLDYLLNLKDYGVRFLNSTDIDTRLKVAK